MGISDRKRSIDVSVNINLDLNEENKPNNFMDKLNQYHLKQRILDNRSANI